MLKLKAFTDFSSVEIKHLRNLKADLQTGLITYICLFVF